MREWLTVIIACLIIGVLLDGLRRMRAAKRNEMRMSLSMHKGTNKEDLEAYGSELPNGGARVVAKRESAGQPEKRTSNSAPGKPVQSKPVHAKPAQGKPVQKAASVSPQPDAKPAAEKPKPAKANPFKPEPVQQAELDLNQQVPLLMDVDDPFTLADAPVQKSASKSKPVEPTLGEDILDDDDGSRQEPSLGAADDVEAEDAPHEIDDDAYDRVLFSGRAEPVAPDRGEPTVETADEPEEVFVVRVMAPKGEVFVGAAIKEAILGAGMRFGSRKIFHMHQDAAGEGPIQFSLVNMVQPGVFDLHRMDENDTPGLSLFMTLPSDAESLPAYEAMVKTARKLAEELGGELRDDQLSTLTAQTIEHNRARVAEFERKRQLEKARM
ncbi:cell division protein ZipA [Simiduia sp. 21SJ11W-1]|uniref:cell division protein ZipA n=1 Tax=Simiduia sp. 21SJ11W-1 TaxID=2909669 RepID=UPI00209D0536|nr:cell division protein ZipA [Simiduia sp. 21SJ11W-1]UTA49242.1 cell division protein ZipA [Simiduia sp. 21SJ11W-1]